MREYNFKIKKRLEPKALIDGLLITGGRINTKTYIVAKEGLENILNGAQDVVLECAGPFAKIKAVSKKRVWKEVAVDGNFAKINPWQDYQYASFAFADVSLGKRGEEVAVKMRVRDGKDEALLSFKIRRTDENVDLPVYKLFICGKNVITKSDVITWLSNGTKPNFNGSEPTTIEVRTSYPCMKTVTIDGNPCTVEMRKDEKGKDEWYAKGKVDGVQASGASGKEVLLSILPSGENDFEPINWSFRLIFVPATPMNIEYEINGKDSSLLDPSFLEGIQKGQNPLLNLPNKYLNLKFLCEGELESAKINEERIGRDKVFKEGNNYVFFYSMELNSEEKSIDVTITPEDKAVYTGGAFKFRVRGNGELEKITPELYEISGDKNFSKEKFLNKLTDGSKPIYETYKDEANIFIKLLGYQKDFLCKEVRFNGEKIELQREAGVFGLPDMYNIRKSISVSNEPIDVLIEFVASEQASNLTWEFKVKGGGKKPSISAKRIKRFVINGLGATGGAPLPKSLTEHLTDGSNPLYQFDGKKAIVEVGCYDATLIEKIDFIMDDNVEETKVPAKNGYIHSATHTFTIEDLSAHSIKLALHPKNKEDFSPLVLEFQLQSTGKKPPIKPVFFELNEVKEKNGHKVNLKAETAILTVYSEQNILKKVKIGEKGVDEAELDVEEVILVTNKKIWKAEREVSLLDGSGKAATKTFILRALPINVGEYDEATCEYTITGTKFEANNAEFSYREGKPEIFNQIDWLPNCNSRFPDDYGAKDITLIAYTMSPRAVVKCQIVGLDDAEIAGCSELILTANKNKHTSSKISLFEDKPTMLKIWVEAEDGSKNNEKGLWRFTYNNVSLKWDWQDKAKNTDFEKVAYGTIELERSEVESSADKKIYLCFGALAKTQGYVLDVEGLPNTQTPYSELERVKTIQYYKTAVDISSLVSTSPASKIEVLFKMKKRGKHPCINQKVIIKLK